MSNASALKFIRQAAVKHDDLRIELCHMVIKNGQARATNGLVAMGTPVDLDLECAPNADQFGRAVDLCGDVISIRHLDKTDRVSVSSGKFRALIPCIDMATVRHPMPSGREIDCMGEEFFHALKALAPLVSKDKTMWANGILVRGKSMFATNNVLIAEYYVGKEFPYEINIPLQCVQAMLKVGEIPERVLIDASSITLMYEDGRWLKTALLERQWPELDNVFSRSSFRELPVIDNELFTALKTLKAFGDTDDAVFLDEQLKVGDATYDLECSESWGVYSIQSLQLLESVAKNIDFNQYPKQVPFTGGRMRGIIMGKRS